MSSSEQAKLFVGGISRETSEDALREHFQSYGTVLGSVIARDRSTRNPRGFGFVWFDDPASAEKALEDKHVILGRTVEVKKAVPRAEQVPNRQQSRGTSNSCRNESDNHQYKTKKIFVGGLSANLTEKEFKSYFEKFGKITDVVVMHDIATQRPRGFGFITFDLEESVEKVVQNSFHELNDRLVEVKRAVPKEGNSVNDDSFNTRIGGGRGSVHNHHRINYPHSCSNRGILHSYQPYPGYGADGSHFYVSGVYGGWYPMGAYGGVGYEMATPRCSWYGPFTGTRSWPLHFVGSPVFPSYVNGGFSLSGAANGNGIIEAGSPLKINHEFHGIGNAQPDVTVSNAEGQSSFY